MNKDSLKEQAEIEEEKNDMNESKPELWSETNSETGVTKKNEETSLRENTSVLTDSDDSNAVDIPENSSSTELNDDQADAVTDDEVILTNDNDLDIVGELNDEGPLVGVDSSIDGISKTDDLVREEAGNETAINSNEINQPQDEIQSSILVDEYYELKSQDHAQIVSLIEESERELADLKLRKALMEASFEELLQYYNELILQDQDISVIAKKTLLEYFSYELLQPFKQIGLKQSDSYGVWQTKHFSISYQLDEEQLLELSFKINPVNQHFNSVYMQLLTIDPKEMKIYVNDQQVLELIRLWHVEKIFSVNQLSLFNYDINRLFAYFEELGFEVTLSLLDNTQTLSVQLESPVALSATILDDIFITAMESDEYEFEKLQSNRYEILLDHSQKLIVNKEQSQQKKASLFIYSDKRKRSLLDFFTSYPFLVPLIIRS